MPQRPPDVVPEIVQRDLTEEQLQAYLASPYLSVDTETLGLQQLRDRLCLVQLCDQAGRGTIVQIPRDQVISSTPEGDARAAPQAGARGSRKYSSSFTSRASTWPCCITTSASTSAPLFCTRTASKLVRTYTDRHGLKDVALELLDVEMDKVTRHTDWASPTLDAGPGPIRDLRRHHADPDHEAARRDARARGAQGAGAECFRVIPVMAALDLRGYDLLFEH